MIKAQHQTMGEIIGIPSWCQDIVAFIGGGWFAIVNFENLKGALIFVLTVVLLFLRLVKTWQEISEKRYNRKFEKWEREQSELKKHHKPPLKK